MHPVITSRQKSKCALVFAEEDKSLTDGGDEELQLLEVALKVHKTLQ
jgi:replication factor C subunit 2/4